MKVTGFLTLAFFLASTHAQATQCESPILESGDIFADIYPRKNETTNYQREAKENKEIALKFRDKTTSLEKCLINQDCNLVNYGNMGVSMYYKKVWECKNLIKNGGRRPYGSNDIEVIKKECAEYQKAYDLAVEFQKTEHEQRQKAIEYQHEKLDIIKKILKDYHGVDN